MKTQQNSFLNIARNIAITAIIFTILLSYNSAIAHDHSKSEKAKKTESIVRTGTIDLKKIDKNKDGKVFQDQMHWNVISDVPGKCPLCGMTLKEVTLQEAKENLKKNGFKVKE